MIKMKNVVKIKAKIKWLKSEIEKMIDRSEEWSTN